MKKSLLFTAFAVAFACKAQSQNVLLFEDFSVNTPETFNLNPPNGNDNFWINFNGDALTDGSGQSRPEEWFSGTYDIYDSLNIVAVSNSWTNVASIPVANWLMTPPLTINSSNYSLYWKSAPYQTPKYMDGYTVLLSTNGNMETDFTVTLANFAEYTGAPGAFTDSTYSNYTFSAGFVHGADGQYIEYTGDSSRFRGALRPDSVSLAAYNGQTVYIAFVANSHDDNLLFIDDIAVKEFGAVTGKKILYLNNQTDFFSVQNPCAETANLTFYVAQYSEVAIGLLDLNGRVVKRFNKGHLMNGLHRETIDLSDVPQGNYIVQINTNYNSRAQHLAVVK